MNNGGTTPVDGYPTSATWTTKPDTSKPGATTGTATVTYPDGSSVDLTVKVYVDAVAKENNSNNTAQVITKHVAETNEKKTSATPAQQIKHSEKATLPQPVLSQKCNWYLRLSYCCSR